MIHPEDLQISWNLFAELQRGQGPSKGVLRMLIPSKQHPSSLVTYVLVTGYPELNKEGKVDSLVCCYIVITEQKCAAESEALRTKEALNAKRQLEDFIDVTSHEIRNPLSVSLQCSEGISSVVKAVLNKADRSKTKANILISDLQDMQSSADIILQSTAHQKRIVDDIPTVSKLEGGMLTFVSDHSLIAAR